MKSLLFLLFISVSVFAQKNIYSYQEQKLDSLNKELNNRIIEPSYQILVNNKEIKFEQFKIKSFLNENGLVIKLNNIHFKTYEFITLNEVENGVIELSIASNLRKIKYYEYEQLIIFELNVNPCTGLSCSIEFHLIYDIKNNKYYPFGMFRNNDSNLYRFPNLNIPFYLSKSYEGNLHAGEFQYKYNFFKLDRNNSEFYKKNGNEQSIIIEYQDYVPVKIDDIDLDLL